MTARSLSSVLALAICAAAFLCSQPHAARADVPASAAKPVEGDYVTPSCRFASGEMLPELRMHYTALGKAHRDAHGRIDNAVLILHGTGGSGHSFLSDRV